jgi:hypothetical protein
MAPRDLGPGCREHGPTPGGGGGDSDRGCGGGESGRAWPRVLLRSPDRNPHLSTTSSRSGNGQVTISYESTIESCPPPAPAAPAPAFRKSFSLAFASIRY